LSDGEEDRTDLSRRIFAPITAEILRLKAQLAA